MMILNASSTSVYADLNPGRPTSPDLNPGRVSGVTERRLDVEAAEIRV